MNVSDRPLLPLIKSHEAEVLANGSAWGGLHALLLNDQDGQYRWTRVPCMECSTQQHAPIRFQPLI